MKILIVDDDQVSALCLKMFVKDTFASPFITVCHSYEDAVSRIAQTKFDLAFIDYRLHRADRDGCDLAKLLDCQKIIVTGFDMKHEDYQRCEEVGVTAYIQKPADRAKVRNSVQRAEEPSISAIGMVSTALAVLILFVLAGIECLAGALHGK
jgi:CheY-like chemotaxis protein